MDKVLQQTIRDSYQLQNVDRGYKEQRHFIYDLIEDGFYDFNDLSFLSLTFFMLVSPYFIISILLP